jgi:hypothetical protein
MRYQRLLLALTIANSAALGISFVSQGKARADAVPAVLRGRSLEIVDDQGRVRASIAVLPPGTSAKEGSEHETVLLRLITERGRPSVKIGSSEESAGLSLTGPTGTSNTYVILGAHGTSSSLKLRNENGREQVIQPD